MCSKSDNEVLFFVLHSLTKHYYWICRPNKSHLNQTVNYWKALLKAVFATNYEKTCDQLYRK